MKSVVVRDPLRGLWWGTYNFTIKTKFSYQFSYATLTSTILFHRQYKRFGAMAAFENLQEFSEHFLDFVGLFRKRPLDEDDNLDFPDGLHVGSPPTQPQIPPVYMNSEDKWTHYPYILNVAIKSNEKDEVISQMCSEFCQINIDNLKQYEIRRVTFIVLRSKEFPKYFTFRARLNYR